MTRNFKTEAALGESLVEMLSDMGSTPIISTIGMALARNGRSSFIARDSAVFLDISESAVFRIYHVQTYRDHVQTHEKTDNLLDTFS